MSTTVSNAAVRSIDRLVAPARSQATDAIAGKLRTIWIGLKFTFALVPIIAGLDKFTNLLTNWELYLNPMLARVLPIGPHVFMEIAGVIEIVAGLIVFYRPRLGALIVTVWLGSIALSLLASGHFLDVAVRDVVMAVAAFTLANLTPIVESNKQKQQ